ncbi:MAG: YraN family protein [Thiobacillaceae bacterium]|nr:YraN family protein [Thiobacillaceae bacterium]MCX7672017.1 YraN family protein [Thiobacillaceae bacterium]MDW8324782.1 YraN family protein [Burkholderiales bacterium]
MRGAEAERQAAEYLQSRGLVVLERNWRCRLGEIDLVCRDGATLVFVEVRARSRPGYGGALESITAGKRARLRRAAALYLARSGHGGACRFDAIVIEGGRLAWLRDAFDAGEAPV